MYCTSTCTINYWNKKAVRSDTLRQLCEMNGMHRIHDMMYVCVYNDTRSHREYKEGKVIRKVAMFVRNYMLHRVGLLAIWDVGQV